MTTFKTLCRKSDGQILGRMASGKEFLPINVPDLFINSVTKEMLQTSMPEIDWNNTELIEVTVIPTAETCKERIICAAIWYVKGKLYSNHPINVTEGTVLFGPRHNVFELLITLYPNYKQDQCAIQGFLTSTNRFVDREEGLKIAIESKQVPEELIKNKRLYSEDLY